MLGGLGGFVARALEYGGMVFEDTRPDMLAEAMPALENGLRKWFEATATAAMLHLSSLGNIKTQTARAFDAAEMQKILGLLPK